MLSTNGISKTFIRFLKENNVYYQFISYYGGNSFIDISIIDYLRKPIYQYSHEEEYRMQSDYIVDSFDWSNYNGSHDEQIDWVFISNAWKELHEYIAYGK